MGRVESRVVAGYLVLCAMAMGMLVSHILFPSVPNSLRAGWRFKELALGRMAYEGEMGIIDSFPCNPISNYPKQFKYDPKAKHYTLDHDVTLDRPVDITDKLVVIHDATITFKGTGMLRQGFCGEGGLIEIHKVTLTVSGGDVFPWSIVHTGRKGGLAQ